MYFAPDMSDFVGQIMKWLKKGGTFFVGYQEGEMMPKTDNAHTTVFAKALAERGINYIVFNITKQTYDLFVKKRKAAFIHKVDFENENHKEWFDLLIMQTECVNESYELFANKMARYIYIIRK